MTTLSLFGLLSVSAQQAAASDQLIIPEENYSFLAITAGPCIPKIGARIEPKYEAACKRMTEPRRYRGTWFVAFETSFFTPVGKQDCVETKGTDCAELTGKALPWPGRWACPRRFEVEFVGRRNLLPQFYDGSAYKIVVEKVMSVNRLPDPPHEPGECDLAVL